MQPVSRIGAVMGFVSRNRRRIGFVWIGFSIVFSALAAYHYYQSTHNIDHFSITVRPKGVQIMGMDVDAPIEEFANKFNNFIDNQNTSSKNLNLASFAGYVVAAFTSLLSAWLELSAGENGDKKAQGGGGDAGDDKGTGILGEE